MYRSGVIGMERRLNEPETIIAHKSETEKKTIQFIRLLLLLFLSFHFDADKVVVWSCTHGNLLSAEETEFRTNCGNLGPSHSHFYFLIVIFGVIRRAKDSHYGKYCPTTGYRKSYTICLEWLGVRLKCLHVSGIVHVRLVRNNFFSILIAAINSFGITFPPF